MGKNKILKVLEMNGVVESEDTINDFFFEFVIPIFYYTLLFSHSNLKIIFYFFKLGILHIIREKYSIFLGINLPYLLNYFIPI
jgi:hypothetical protein